MSIMEREMFMLREDKKSFWGKEIEKRIERKMEK